MSSDLVPLADDEAGARLATLGRLVAAAEDAGSAHTAHQVMVAGQVAADVLARLRAPFEQSRMAGKASVLAARKLGLMLADLSAETRRTRNFSGGSKMSDRWRLADELGIERSVGYALVRLSRIPDPDFQRYIQRRDVIPTLSGALALLKCGRHVDMDSWRAERRRKSGVNTPRNPSLDEAYSLVGRAAAHVDSVRTGPTFHAPTDERQARRALAKALDLLYEVEDILRPYRGGYAE